MKNTKHQNLGFTIVELLIVIVVIGILAAITIVAYNGIQKRARDANTRNDVAAISKALHLWNVDNGDYMEAGSGCGSNGNGNGWFNVSNGTTYPESINNCLKNAGYIQRDIIGPTGVTYCASGNMDCSAYLKCSGSMGTYVFANLESLPTATTEADGTNCPAYDTSYGMNYVVRVN